MLLQTNHNSYIIFYFIISHVQTLPPRQTCALIYIWYIVTTVVRQIFICEELNIFFNNLNKN